MSKFEIGQAVQIADQLACGGEKGIVVRKVINHTAQGRYTSYRVYIDSADVTQDYEEEELMHLNCPSPTTQPRDK